MKWATTTDRQMLKSVTTLADIHPGSNYCMADDVSKVTVTDLPKVLL
ncbi:hypothetical protein ABMA58_10360 [Oceanospirillum sp. HFRX-1_2]